MPLELFDTHNHLYAKEYDADRDAVIERARQAGVVGMLCVAEDLDTSRRCVELAQRYPLVHAAVGLHPHKARDDTDEHYAALRELAQAEKKTVAIGEIGLDYHYDHSPRETQRETFRRHIRLAHDLALPLIVHCRDAHDDAEKILRGEQRGLYRGVMHGYGGTADEAHAFLELGFHIALGGPLTFKNARTPREVASAVPIERLLIETDAPSLAPQRVRGTRNEPAHITDVAEKLAELKNLSVEDVGRITTRSARLLFGLDLPARGDTIAYKIRDSLYLNITNRCTNQCIFCARTRDPVVKGHDLRLAREPTVGDILNAVGDPAAYREIVFCGYGEPLIRLDVVKEVGKILVQRHVRRIRIDTNGQANLIHGRNVVPELAAFTDEISVSLNAPNEAEYARLCRPEDRGPAFEAVKAFIREATKRIPVVVASVVAVPGLDIEACRALAEELGARFRVRPYNEVG